MCTPVLAECSLGEEVFMMEVFQYRRAYMSTLKSGASQPTVTDQSGLLGIPDATLLKMRILAFLPINPCSST